METVIKFLSDVLKAIGAVIPHGCDSVGHFCRNYGGGRLCCPAQPDLIHRSLTDAAGGKSVPR